MIVARWHVSARFGHKQALIEEIRTWWNTIGKEIGQTDVTFLTGSIGAAESVIQVDVRCRDLAELHQQWDALAQREDHVQFSNRIEPLLVSGSTRWEVFRSIG
jgi:hypothetical protein